MYARKPPIALQKPTLAVGQNREFLEPSRRCATKHHPTLGKARKTTSAANWRERERESESDGYDGFLALPATVATVTVRWSNCKKPQPPRRYVGHPRLSPRLKLWAPMEPTRHHDPLKALDRVRCSLESCFCPLLRFTDSSVGNPHSIRNEGWRHCHVSKNAGHRKTPPTRNCISTNHDCQGRSFRSLSNKTHRFWVLCDDDRTYEICGLPHENEALRLFCNMS